MEKYEEFIKLLKEAIEESESNSTTQSENAKSDTDIIFDDLMRDSRLRLGWMNEFKHEFKYDFAKRHVIRVGENLVKILEILNKKEKDKK